VRPPCEIMVVKLLPALRALISHYLIQDYGFTQNKVAQALGVTQASISRGLSQLNRFEKYYTPSVHRTAKTFARQLSQDRLGLEEGIAALCTFCTTQKIGGILCQLHREDNPNLAECFVCGKGITPDNRIEVLNKLSRSAELLANTKEFTPLIPQVGSQLVMSIPNPIDLDDVAGFPSRIVLHKKRPHSFTRPEFRGSDHLSQVLLVVQKHDPNVKAAMVFRYLEGLEAVLKKIGLRFVKIHRQPIEDQKDTDEALHAGIELALKGKESIDVLIDKGLIGIEPVVYLFAPDAEMATEQGIEIARKLKSEE
jgi:predicted fused transcriptional regulator/phosphomethylpyrimidine kinase/predicted transcriptional regulator